ncbi:EAL domain-containing protein [Babesia caballi]|uniref:EAL domain-containing protein n=1 Tax=Babesia caballi TaxID=5871 RepID=A0AAV4LZI4_BABCB|nr:EAL domain-containing protein [Babesia caballi]
MEYSCALALEGKLESVKSKSVEAMLPAAADLAGEIQGFPRTADASEHVHQSWELAEGSEKEVRGVHRKHVQTLLLLVQHAEQDQQGVLQLQPQLKRRDRGRAKLREQRVEHRSDDRTLHRDHQLDCGEHDGQGAQLGRVVGTALGSNLAIVQLAAVVLHKRHAEHGVERHVRAPALVDQREALHGFADAPVVAERPHRSGDYRLAGHRAFVGGRLARFGVGGPGGKVVGKVAPRGQGDQIARLDKVGGFMDGQERQQQHLAEAGGQLVLVYQKIHQALTRLVQEPGSAQVQKELQHALALTQLRFDHKLNILALPGAFSIRSRACVSSAVRPIFFGPGGASSHRRHGGGAGIR